MSAIFVGTVADDGIELVVDDKRMWIPKDALVHYSAELRAAWERTEQDMEMWRGEFGGCDCTELDGKLFECMFCKLGAALARVRQAREAHS